MKYRLLALALYALSGLPLGAATVSFLVIETGLPQDAVPRRFSGMWESGLLDVFFDAGHIVSNAPIKRLDYQPSQKFPDEALEELDAALDGGAEFLVIALLDYRLQSGTDMPSDVILRIFAVSPLRLVYEQQYSAMPARNLDDAFSNLKKAAKGLISHLN